MSFACREELAIKGVKPNTDIPFQYTHTINPSVLEMVYGSRIHPLRPACSLLRGRSIVPLDKSRKNHNPQTACARHKTPRGCFYPPGRRARSAAPLGCLASPRLLASGHHSASPVASPMYPSCLHLPGVGVPTQGTPSHWLLGAPTRRVER
jgi:hypothetical protein